MTTRKLPAWANRYGKSKWGAKFCKCRARLIIQEGLATDKEGKHIEYKVCSDSGVQPENCTIAHPEKIVRVLTRSIRAS